MTGNAIEIRNLKKRFNAETRPVFDGLDFDVPEHQVTFLLGPSGVGKSVLLKHIVGLLEPDAGEIRVFGDPVPYHNAKELNAMRGCFGMLFQGSALFDSMSVFRNVAFPLRAHRREMTDAEMRDVVTQKLRDVGLDPKTSMDKMPGQLSGGMRKRVGLARAIVLNPRILLYDEPTTGLDPVTRLTVENLLIDTNKTMDVTSLIVSHDIPFAARTADRIVFLSEGKAVFSGSRAEFLKCNHPVVREFREAEAMHTEATP